MERAEAKPILRIDCIRPLIRVFFHRITERQWKLLKSGSPDEATKILQVEMMLSMISSVTKNLLAALGKAKTPDNQKQILSSLDHLFPLVLRKAFGIPNIVENASLKTLSHIIKTEVKENVTLALSNQRVIEPAKLEIMVSHASKIFKLFAAKMEVFASSHPSRDRTDIFLCNDVKENTDHVKTHPEEMDDNGGAGDCLPDQRLQSFLKKIQTELVKIFPPMLNDMSESEYKKLQSEASVDLQTFRAEVSTVFRAKGMTQCSLRTVSVKLKHLFTMCFLNVWLYRMMEQLNKQHQSHKFRNSRSVEFLVNSVKSRFSANYSAEDHLAQWLRDFSNKGAVLFSKELSDLIYFMIMPDVTGASDVEAKISKRFYVLLTYSQLYSDIRSKVWIFMVVINWKLKQLSVDFTKTLVLAMREGTEWPKAGGATASQDEGQDANLEQQKDKRRVKVLLEKIVYHLQLEGKMMHSNRHEIINSLLDKVWAEVKDAELSITPDSFKNLDRNIHKHLCKKFGTPEMVLFLISCQDPVITKSILVIFEEQLLKVKKEPRRISTLCSPLASVLCRSSRKGEIAQ